MKFQILTEKFQFQISNYSDLDVSLLLNIKKQVGIYCCHGYYLSMASSHGNQFVNVCLAVEIQPTKFGFNWT